MHQLSAWTRSRVNPKLPQKKNTSKKISQHNYHIFQKDQIYTIHLRVEERRPLSLIRGRSEVSPTRVKKPTLAIEEGIGCRKVTPVLRENSPTSQTKQKKNYSKFTT